MNEYALAAFGARQQAFAFADKLRRSGVRCDLIGTPATAGVGCGLSVRFAPRFLAVAKSLLPRTATAFAGFFAVSGGAVRRV